MELIVSANKSGFFRMFGANQFLLKKNNGAATGIIVSSKGVYDGSISPYNKILINTQVNPFFCKKMKVISDLKEQFAFQLNIVDQRADRREPHETSVHFDETLVKKVSGKFVYETEFKHKIHGSFYIKSVIIKNNTLKFHFS